MQKREKMVARRSGVVMAPVISPRWWRAARRSMATRSRLSELSDSDSLPLPDTSEYSGKQSPTADCFMGVDNGSVSD